MYGRYFLESFDKYVIAKKNPTPNALGKNSITGKCINAKINAEKNTLKFVPKPNRDKRNKTRDCAIKVSITGAQKTPRIKAS